MYCSVSDIFTITMPVPAFKIVISPVTGSTPIVDESPDVYVTIPFPIISDNVPKNPITGHVGKPPQGVQQPRRPGMP